MVSFILGFGACAVVAVLYPNAFAAVQSFVKRVIDRIRGAE